MLLQAYEMLDKGMIVVLEEMDVARRNQNPGWEVVHQCVRQLECIPQACGSHQLRGKGATRGPPLNEWTTSTMLGAHRALGDGG